jgi:hypothetical protein
LRGGHLHDVWGEAEAITKKSFAQPEVAPVDARQVSGHTMASVRALKRGGLVCALIVLVAPPVAARETANLVYERGVGADTCPDEAALRVSVATRLGYDPFVAGSAREVRASIRRRRAEFVATVAIRGADGAVLARAPITSTSTDCTEIATSLALAISIAVDPLSFTRPPPTDAPQTIAPSPTPREPAAPPVREPAPSAPPPERGGLSARVGIGGFASVGQVPAPSFGPVIFAGVRSRSSPFALGIEGRWDVPASTEGPRGGEVVGTLLVATLAPCVEGRRLYGCALGSIGPFFGRGTGVDNEARDTSLYAAVGARVGVDVELHERLSLRAQIDGLVPLVRTVLRIAGADAWASPVVTGAAGLGLVAHFR